MSGFKSTMSVYLFMQLCIILSALSFFAVVSGGYIKSTDNDQLCSNSTQLPYYNVPALYTPKLHSHNPFFRKELMLPNNSVVFLGDIFFVNPMGVSSMYL
eukprot:Phypoly_transcript_26131.p1 GENE.Phypoly_transcript_26131~~Phypoly_transcript_26131.p1  ORF type:complete len:100 (+),score=15.78 Phypoly_transcript_26131:77-376(+)